MTSRELLDRIAALVALASSPQIEEARTAANKACALLREHRAVIGFEEDGALITKQLGVAAAPNRPSGRRSTEHKTIVIFRCQHCGRRVDKPGKCATCVQLNVTVGIWRVTCEQCMRSSPPAMDEPEVNRIAYDMGFRVTDDDRTLCPSCYRWHQRNAV